MYQTLVPCPGCQRHVRLADGDCPFCGATIENAQVAPDVTTKSGRLSRAAVFAFGVTMAASVTACGDDTGDGDGGGSGGAAAGGNNTGATSTGGSSTGGSATGGDGMGGAGGDIGVGGFAAAYGAPAGGGFN